MQTIKLGGSPFATGGDEELYCREALGEVVLRTLGNSQFAVYQHAVRRRGDAGLSPVDADGLPPRLDGQSQDRCSGTQIYTNELFVTIVRRPLQRPTGIFGRVSDWIARKPDRRAKHIASEKHALDQAREALMMSLSAYDPQMLGVYDMQDAQGSEPLEFLAYLFNANTRPIALPPGDLRYFIPARRISFGQDAIELAATGQWPHRFVAILSIKDYPGSTFRAIFDELYGLPFELNLTHSFAFVAQGTMAEHHTSIAVSASNIDGLQSHLGIVEGVLADRGINAVREEIALAPTFWAQFPANFSHIQQRGVIPAKQFAGFPALDILPSRSVGESQDQFEKKQAVR